MEFRILGPLDAIEDGRSIVLQGAKQRALLAVLLLNANQVVSSDRLIDELWEDEPPESGLTALQVRVSQLRKTLGAAGSLLETHARGYVLCVGPEDLDLYRFERLVAGAAVAERAAAAAQLHEALALWRGPPLAEFAYDGFAQAPIGRLEELRLAALERRIEVDLTLGRHGDLVPELEALVVEHPLREQFRAQLMLALYRPGRQAEALEVYQSTRRTLVETLGIEPTRPMQELENAILNQAPELDLEPLSAPPPSILVAVRDETELARCVRLAEPLARRPVKELVLSRLVPNADELSTAAADLEACRADVESRGIASRAAAFVSSEFEADVVRLAVEQDVDLVVVSAAAWIFDDPFLQHVLERSPCDVAVVAGAGDSATAGPVLVPFVGVEHDWAAVELGAWLAGSLDVPLVLAGPREGVGGRDSSRLLASASFAVQRALRVPAQPLLLEPEPDALAAAAEEAGIVVVGLTDRWRKEGLGPARHALATHARTPVVLVRRGLRPGGLAPRDALTRFTWSLNT